MLLISYSILLTLRHYQIINHELFLFTSRPLETDNVTTLRSAGSLLAWTLASELTKELGGALDSPGMSKGSHFTCRCVTPVTFSGKVCFNSRGEEAGKGAGGTHGEQTQPPDRFRRNLGSSNNKLSTVKTTSCSSEVVGGRKWPFD